MAKYRLTKGSHSALAGDKRVEYHAGVKGQDIMELSDAQAKLPHLRKRIEKVHSSETVIDLKPDEDDEDGIVALNAPDTDDLDPKIAAVLSGNVDQVLAYINDHEDDTETLEALREGETAGKARKGVLDAINALLGE